MEGDKPNLHMITKNMILLRGHINLLSSHFQSKSHTFIMRWQLAIILICLTGLVNSTEELPDSVLSLFLQPPSIIHPTGSPSHHTTTTTNFPPPPNEVIKTERVVSKETFDRMAEGSSYGPPNGIPYYSNNQFQPQNQNPQNNQHYQFPPQRRSKIVKFVSVFVAPPPQESYRPQKISIENNGEAAEKHVNIIFIKNPSAFGGETAAEVDLPPPPEQKTLVYVLNEKFNPKIKLNQSPTHHQENKPPPNVFFIQYKKNHQQEQHHPNHHQTYQPPIHTHNHPIIQNHPHHQQQSDFSNNLEDHFEKKNSANSFEYYSSSSSSSSLGDEVLPRTTYAPTMPFDKFQVPILSKREILDNSSSSNSGGSSDFRPYKYAANMDHRYYGVTHYKI